MTKEYGEKYGTLFHSGQLPIGLPEPIMSPSHYKPPCVFPGVFVERQNASPRNIDVGCSFPWWMSKNSPRFIDLLKVDQIRIYDNTNLRNKKVQSGSKQKHGRSKDGASAADKTSSHNNDGAASNSDFKTAPCAGLKPFNNLDELLYQFYINLDSDCLFKMPIEDLEKIWRIEIKPGRMKFEDEQDENFYLYYKGSKTDHIYYIILSPELGSKYISRFMEKEFPRALPRPLINDDRDAYTCWWYNSDITHAIKFLYEGLDTTEFVIYQPPKIPF